MTRGRIYARDMDARRIAACIAERTWGQKLVLMVYVMPDGAVITARKGCRADQAISRVYAVICVGAFAHGVSIRHLADEIASARAECMTPPERQW